MDAYVEAGPGGNHLGSAHTMRHFATANQESTLADASSFEQWTADGALDIQMRANRQWKQMHGDYEPPSIDEAVDRELLSLRRRPQVRRPRCLVLTTSSPTEKKSHRSMNEPWVA